MLCLEALVVELVNVSLGRIVTLPQSLDVTDFHPHVILDVLVGYVLACLPGHEVPQSLVAFTLPFPTLAINTGFAVLVTDPQPWTSPLDPKSAA